MTPLNCILANANLIKTKTVQLLAKSHKVKIGNFYVLSEAE